MIYSEYDTYRNSIDVNIYVGYILRIDYNVAEEGLKTTPSSQCGLNALAIDEPLEYARLALEGKLQMWIDTEDIYITRNGKVVAKLSNPYQDRVDVAKSLFGILPADMTLEEARKERLNTI